MSENAVFSIILFESSWLDILGWWWVLMPHQLRTAGLDNKSQNLCPVSLRWKNKIVCECRSCFHLWYVQHTYPLVLIGSLLGGVPSMFFSVYWDGVGSCVSKLLKEQQRHFKKQLFSLSSLNFLPHCSHEHIFHSSWSRFLSVAWQDFQGMM